MKTVLGSIAAVLLTSSAMAPAMAQVAPPRLSIPDASQTLAPLKNQAAPRPAPIAPLPQATAPQEGNLHFTHVHVTGATRVPAEKIAEQFAPLLDRKVSAAELKPVLDKINALYEAAGLPLGRAMVPAQRIKDGELTVRVVEGYVAKVLIETEDKSLRGLIQGMASPLTHEKPLTRAKLERVLLLIQDLPGITLGSQFADMDPQTGATTLVLSANIKPVTVGFALDNRTNLGSLPILPFITATLNNLLGMGEQIVLTALLSPRQADDAYYSVGVTKPVNNDGLTAGIDASWAQLLDSVNLRPFEVRSRTSQLAAKLRYAWIEATDEKLALQGRTYYTRAAYSLVQLPATLAEDQYVAGELSAEYSRSFSPDLGLGATLRLTQGMASLTGEPHTRLNTKPNFSKVRLQSKLVWRPRENVTLNFSAMGQYSPHSLMASEEIVFGGMNFGRAFNPSEITGDSGFGVNFTPEYRIALGDKWSLTPFVTADYARAYNRRRDLQPNGELVSAGGGVKIGLKDYAEVTLEMDKPLNRTPLDRSNRDWRFFTGVSLGLDKAVDLIGQIR